MASFLGSVVLVRTLSQNDFGIYSLFYALVPVISTVLSLGLENTLRRYQPEYLSQGENRLAHLVVRRIGAIRLVANIVLALLTLLLWDKIAPFFKIAGYRDYFLLFSLIVITHFQCSILNSALSSHLLQKYSAGVVAAFSLTKLLGYVAGVVLFDLNLWLVFSIDLGAYLMFYASQKYFYQTRADHSKGTLDGVPKEERRRMVRYGAYYNFNDAGTLALFSSTDNFFLAALMDPIAVGAYSLAVRLNDMIQYATPLRQLDSVVYPMFFALDYRNYPEKVRKYFTLLLSLSLLEKIPILAFMYCYHAELVQVVFGGKFVEYSFLLPAVLLFANRDLHRRPGRPGLSAEGKGKRHPREQDIQRVRHSGQHRAHSAHGRERSGRGARHRAVVQGSVHLVVRAGLGPLGARTALYAAQRVDLGSLCWRSDAAGGS